MASQTIKKGSRVCFPLRPGGELLYGVVSKMQTSKGKATVILDGMKKAANVPLQMLKVSDKPLPKDPPHEMDRWDVRKFSPKAEMSEETQAFSAIITFDGKDVFQASNSGQGGNNRYHRVGTEGPSLRDLEQAAAQWAADHGYEDLFEAEDAWVNWKATMAPYGVLASDHLAEMKQEIEEISGMRP